MSDDPHDPSNQSGRPWFVTGAVTAILVVLGIMLVVGLIVLT
jgi:hypothetical protein